ncbi:AI-2E family transporter [Acetobacter farinalis]|uniref:AI-2E family transporter n=1 Tax=Acetobacter farinalis TaxID=1260984 RepID=A0ABT3Q8V0_9PROT|nr:AI-2E family transporter [Acetobacter farinalis]MCX2561723.1 AI-2E family transporter [Acetobacter farinalis]NHO30256.1 AI-2E family transporter [Acetobacter farinalis]
MPTPAPATPAHQRPTPQTRIVLGAMTAMGMVLCSLWVIRPFLPATIWAITIGVTTWPLLLRIQKVLWGSRALAVTVTSLVALMVYVLPIWLATTTVLTHTAELKALADSALAFRIPPAPEWLHSLPFIGQKAGLWWQQIENVGLPQLANRILPDTGKLISLGLDYAGSFGMLAIQFLLTLIILAALHSRGEAAANLVMNFGYALAEERGRQMVLLAGRTIRGVAVGVTVTALVESTVGGVGMAITGVPWASILTAITFIACLLQAGPGVTLIPAVIWMFFFHSAGPAIVLLGFTILAIVVDNLLRPFLIRKQANVPLVLIMVGVIGGLTAFGLVGIFVGPMILSVTYTLVKSWLADAGTPVAGPGTSQPLQHAVRTTP